MASRFDSMVADDAGVFFDEFGEDCSYRPNGDAGQAKTIKVIAYWETRGSIFGGDVVNEFNSLRMDIRSASNTVGHVSPTEYRTGGSAPDTIVLGGVTWTVKRLLNKGQNDGVHQLEVYDGGNG